MQLFASVDAKQQQQAAAAAAALTSTSATITKPVIRRCRRTRNAASYSDCCCCCYCCVCFCICICICFSVCVCLCLLSLQGRAHAYRIQLLQGSQTKRSHVQTARSHNVNWRNVKREGAARAAADLPATMVTHHQQQQHAKEWWVWSAWWIHKWERQLELFERRQNTLKPQLNSIVSEMVLKLCTYSTEVVLRIY